MTKKFEVNDRVKGVGNHYGITNCQMTMGRVTSVDSDGMFSLIVVSHESRPEFIGREYAGLNPDWFELVKRPAMKPYNRLEAVAALAKDKSALLDYDLSHADLSYLDLRSANLRGSDLSSANLSSANLSSANLSSANLRGSDLSGSDLRGSDLSGSDLRGSDLSSANLRGSDLSSANLRGSDLSGSDGLMSAIAFIDTHFERTVDGYIAYKTFGSSYRPNSKWIIEPGSVIEEVVNPDRTCDCGCGINVAPLDWVKRHADGNSRPVWKVLIRYEWLAGVVVPFGSDGKIRCEKVQLVESTRE